MVGAMRDDVQKHFLARHRSSVSIREREGEESGLKWAIVSSVGMVSPMRLYVRAKRATTAGCQARDSRYLIRRIA